MNKFYLLCNRFRSSFIIELMMLLSMAKRRHLLLLKLLIFTSVTHTYNEIIGQFADILVAVSNDTKFYRASLNLVSVVTSLGSREIGIQCLCRVSHLYMKVFSGTLVTHFWAKVGKIRKELSLSGWVSQPRKCLGTARLVISPITWAHYTLPDVS